VIVVIVQLRANAIRIVASSGSALSSCPLPGRRGGAFEPAINAVAVSKDFTPQSSRSKMPREFVKPACLRRTARDRSVRSRITDRGESIVIDDNVGRQINKP
jgi:hypothetical protein